MLEWRWALALIAAGEIPQFLHASVDPEDEDESEEEEIAA